MTVVWKPFLALAAAFSLSTAPLHAHEPLSSVKGIVFQDMNSDGLVQSVEAISGVHVKLFQDDGDGVFDAALDALLDAGSTDANGSYAFSNLEMNSHYFVYQEAQTVNSLNLQDSVTSMIQPGHFNMMVDDFDSQNKVEATPVNTVGSDNFPSSTALGGERDLHVEFIFGSAEADLYANPFGLTSVLEFNQSAGVNAIATVTWDGLDDDTSTSPAVGGLAGMDLTQDHSDAFAFYIGIDAAGAGESLTMRVFSGDGMSTATINVPVTPNGTATEFQVIPFASFSGEADFTSVDAVQLSIGGRNPSIDAQIGPIGLVGPAINNIAVSVPEPSTVLLAASALLWFGSRRRKGCRI